MVDIYLNTELSLEKRSNLEAPYRAYDFIEFYKSVKSKNEILAVIINEEDHYVSLLLGDPICKERATQEE